MMDLAGIPTFVGDGVFHVVVESPRGSTVKLKYDPRLGAIVYLGGLVRRRWLSGRQRPALVGLTCERMDDNVETFLSGAALARNFARAIDQKDRFEISAGMESFVGRSAISSRRRSRLRRQPRR